MKKKNFLPSSSSFKSKSFFSCRFASPSSPVEAALLRFGNGDEVSDRGGCVTIGLRFDDEHENDGGHVDENKDKDDGKLALWKGLGGEKHRAIGHLDICTCRYSFHHALNLSSRH